MSTAEPLAGSGFRVIKPVRLRSSHYLDEETFTLTYQTVTSFRVQQLLKWLYGRQSESDEVSSDSLDLLDWICGTGQVLLRQESPSVAILHSLPSIDVAGESAVRRVLFCRLAEVFGWLAKESEAATWSEIGLNTAEWIELFALADQICDPEQDRSQSRHLLSTSISRLQIAFDANGLPNSDREIPYTFTKLVARHQLDNNLKARWLKMISGGAASSETIQGGLFVGLRGVLACPWIVEYGEFKSWIEQFCEAVDRVLKLDNHKEKASKDCRDLVIRDYPPYRRFISRAFSELSQRYQWLWFSETRYVLEHTSDVAVIRHVARVMRNASTELYSLAVSRYQQEIRKSNLSPKFEDFLLRSISDPISSSNSNPSKRLDSCRFRGRGDIVAQNRVDDAGTSIQQSYTDYVLQVKDIELNTTY